VGADRECCLSHSPNPHLLDTLTGALSRHTFSTRLEALLAEALAAHQPLALLLIDLDYFKSVNDGFGHQRGDEVLAEVGRRLRASLREVDQLFRYGGDEFVLLLPGVDRQQAVAVAERLLESVRDEPFDGAPPLSLSLSVGLGMFPAEATDAHALFSQADQRAYHAKRAGRGRVIADDEASTTPSHTSDRLLERDGALATARSFLDLHERGVRAQLCVSGPGGAGRSTVLAEVERMAAARRMAVFRVRGRSASRARVLGALRRALHGWPELSLRMGGQAAARALAQACKERGSAGMLLTIDNAAALDDATHDFLRDLLTHPELPHTSLAYVDSPDVSRWALVGSTAQLYLALQPLSADGIRIWLRHALGWEAPPEFAALMLRETGGLPASLHSTVEALIGCGALSSTSHGWLWDAEATMYPAPVRRSPDIAALLAAQPAMVGRAGEIEAIRLGLDAGRLVTLVGAPGIGKTRTALQAAAECQERYRDGACFVALGTLPSADLVPGAIASALRIEPGRNPDPRNRVLSYLRGRELLLVLDNAEHLPGLAGLVTELLEAAPQVVVLVTSHQPLGLPSERPIRLGGLEVDLPSDSAPSDAVRMFLQVVRGHHPQYTPGEEELRAISAVCRLVGGVPLGVELTAVWAGSVPCAQIARALGASPPRGDALESGASNHRGQLGAAIAYSWSMLAAPEQRTLRALAVFRGGFTREAARRVAGASPFFIDALAAKNLLRPMLHGRYQMHGLLHAYAADQLSEHPSEQRAARARHRTYFLALLRDRTDPVNDASSAATELYAELANIRAAWEQAIEDGRVGQINASLRPFGRLYTFAARFDEGVRLIDHTIAWLETQSGQEAPPASRHALAHAWYQRAKLLFYIGPRDAMLDAIGRVQALLEGQRQPQLEGATNLLWGIMLLVHGQLDAAREKLERALALATKVRDWDVVIGALQHLCHAASLQGDGARGAADALEAIRVAEREGYTLHARQTLFFLGFSRFTQERHVEARACFEQNVFHIHEDFAIGILALVNLSATLLEMREYRQALVTAERSIRLANEAGMAYYEALARRVRGLLAHALGRHEDAEQNLRAALAGLEQAGAARDAARARADLALLAHWRGDHNAARALAAQALTSARELHSVLAEAVALVPLGQASLALGQPDAAAEAYERARTLFNAIGRHNRATEIQVWLARVRLAQGRREEARALALAFAAHVGAGEQEQPLDGMYSPIRALLECGVLLEALGDRRADQCRSTAQAVVARVAAQLGDEERSRFLSGVAALEAEDVGSFVVQ
jgi:diguanylate cyclase (GGDEF)-like protein